MVYVFLADGFEEVEALTPVDLMRRAGIEVKTVGVTGEVVTGSHNIPVKADITIDEVELNNQIEMIVLPGGMPGTINLQNDVYVDQTIDFCVKNDKYLAAICAAPKILGGKGLLDGKEAICFPGFEDELVGAKLVDDIVAKDGKFITAKGAGAALKFGLKIVETFLSKEQAEKIEDSLQCK